MIKKLREQIKHGRERIKQIVAYNKKRRKHIKRIERKRNVPTAMFDSVDLTQIPVHAQAVAGYVGGRWPTFSLLVKRYPDAWKVPIAISAIEDAECLDVEPGDATIGEVPDWVRRQIKRGVKKPIVYCSASSMNTLLEVLHHAGIDRSQIRVWTAHWTFHPHLCGPHTCGALLTDADATQWTDEALGRNLDQSYCAPSFFLP